MSDHVYKSSEIVGLSITEILLIIIFGLVLVAQIFSSQLGEARDSAGSVEQELLASGQEAQAVMKVVDELNELMGNPPVEWEGLPDLAAQLDAAKGELSTLRDDMSSLIVAADLPGASLPEVWTTLVRAAKAVDDTQGGLIELVSQVEALKVENEALAEDNKSLRKNLTEVNDQLTDLRVMLEAAGVDSVESLAEANEDLEARVGNLTNEVRGLRNELNS